MIQLDHRLHAIRADLADARLEGQTAAPRFVEGLIREIRAPVAPVRRHPAPDAPLDTQALHGERLRVFDQANGWCWAQLESDGYVGYLPTDALGASGPEPTHRVAALASYVYPAPNIKQPPLARLPFGALLAIVDEHGGFAETTDRGFVWRSHLQPVAQPESDFVAVAKRFVGAPYLWGGRTPDGIDCSGLVQAALAATGRAAPRDSDMQERLGEAVDPSDLAALRRGDLVFWKGHVGIVLDKQRLLHANAYHMAVTVEPLAVAVERIASTGIPISTVRRLG